MELFDIDLSESRTAVFRLINTLAKIVSPIRYEKVHIWCESRMFLSSCIVSIFNCCCLAEVAVPQTTHISRLRLTPFRWLAAASSV